MDGNDMAIDESLEESPLDKKIKRRMSRNKNMAGYTTVYVKSFLKYKCNLCGKIMQNTSMKRLESHQAKCTLLNGSCSNGCTKDTKRRLTHKDEQIQAINAALQDFLVNAKLPVRIVENSYFLAFVDKLRPGYVPPSFEELAPLEWLEETTSEVEENYETEVITDDMDQVKGQESEVVYLVSHNTSSRLEHRTVIGQEASNNSNDSAVTSLMTDICSIPKNRETIDEVMAVLKELSRLKLCDINLDLLSNRESLELFLDHHQSFAQVAKGKSVILSTKVRKSLLNTALVPKVNELLMDLTPATNALAGFETDTMNLAEAVEQWLILESAYSWNKEISQLVANKIQSMDLFSEKALAANILDKRFMGRRMSTKQKSQAERFLYRELSGSGISSYTKYLDDEDECFGHLSKAAAEDAEFARKGFWKATRNTHEDLSKLALYLGSLPVSRGDSFPRG